MTSELVRLRALVDVARLAAESLTDSLDGRLSVREQHSMDALRECLRDVTDIVMRASSSVVSTAALLRQLDMLDAADRRRRKTGDGSLAAACRRKLAELERERQKAR